MGNSIEFILIHMYRRENGYPVIDLLVNNGNDNAVREDYEIICLICFLLILGSSSVKLP
jgi:hypothetical protein